MAELRPLIVKTAKMITDSMDAKIGIVKMDENRPEYRMLDRILTDDMARLALKMGVRKPTTPAELAKKLKWEEEKVQKLLDEMAETGFVEYNRHNADRHKQYVIPVFIVGSGENFMLNKKLMEEDPAATGSFMERMTYLPLELLAGMVPPGGGGLGFHVIPVENAIPNDSMSMDIEHLSHWLEKYRDQLGVVPCVCRRSMRTQGQGCGELEDNVCIVVGDYSDYLIETGKECRRVSYDDIVALLKRTEENGYMHQITNGDGPDDIFAICNCHVGSCYGLRCSQLFNAPNMSASAYRAEVDPKNCVACGKCVEVCPAGAAKLGQKLCRTGEGQISYPKQELPDGHLRWGKDKWNYNYRDDNQINCYDSGTAPCKTACPAHIAVQGYVKMAAQGRYDEALKLIKLDNPFPAVCGSICNRRCENNCTRAKVDNAVAVDEIKKFIARRELNAETRYIPKKVRHKGDETDYTEKIAVIGAGPAGLSCAYFLAEMSYPVTVFDRNPVPGGMLSMGIPSFRLEKDVLNAEIDVLREMGVEFRCGVEVGRDITIEQLRSEGYKGFCLAIGAQKSVSPGIAGEELRGVFGGVDFLREVNLGGSPAIGRRCAVIGGGNVAVDVVRTALRMGAEEAYIVYRRSKEDMPADPAELEEAVAEGALVRYLNTPVEILGEDGRVCGLRVELMEPGEPDSKGRHRPVGTGVFETIELDSVISAIGQQIDWGGLDTGRLEKNATGTAIADEVTLQTSQEDIFVCGDVYTGPKFAIDAIAAGREAAVSLHRYVHPGQSLTLARNRRQFIALNRDNVSLSPESFDAPARQQVCHDRKKAKTMSDDRMVFTEEQVRAEASRCLGCGATVVDQNKCIGCGLCTTRCRFDAIHLVRNHPEFAHYINGDYSKAAIALYGAKKAARIAIKDIKDTVAGIRQDKNA
ncbi:MAG: FAD-dependent oxidoreductase [Oscillospiraceae bacterium]|nr:FAD-dependent oxidoreductase [Oscillospiraceae bacterium]